jgi:hypothetical protein
VVTPEDHRERARCEDLADGSLDLLVRPDGVGGQDGRVAEVDDAQSCERVDLRLEMRPRRAARRADRSRREARAGSIRDELVGRRADDRDVERRKLGRVLRVRRAPVRQKPGVVRLVAERLPPLEWIDRVQKSFWSFIAAPMSPLILSLPLM